MKCLSFESARNILQKCETKRVWMILLSFMEDKFEECVDVDDDDFGEKI